ncbi:MAG TPA: hypothetical protein VIM65_01555 [Cyclobacteriaceae bacterium]
MAKKKELLIIHFRSAMDYPPVYNIARYLAGIGVSITLITSRKKESSLELENYGVRVIEVALTNGSGLRTYLAYFNYYFKAFIELVRKPKIPVLYYESISSPPVFLFSLLFPFSKRTLAIHYHEYFDKEEHKRQSFLERLGRRLEPLLFKRSSWISHTNVDRLSRFHSEFPFIGKSKLHLMPNYPSEKWVHAPRVKEVSDKVRLVYVGSVSMESLFLSELGAWLATQNGKFTCDIYSKNMDDKVLQFIQQQPPGLINFKGSIHYDNLPSLLPAYDVGLILYNGHYSTNFVYNAPNKLFEYLACGLDVWFSNTLLSSYPYETINTYPKVVKIDFSNMSSFNAKDALNRDGMIYKKSHYTLEAVYNEMANSILI